MGSVKLAEISSGDGKDTILLGRAQLLFVLARILRNSIVHGKSSEWCFLDFPHDRRYFVMFALALTKSKRPLTILATYRILPNGNFQPGKGL